MQKAIKGTIIAAIYVLLLPACSMKSNNGSSGNLGLNDHQPSGISYEITAERTAKPNVFLESENVGGMTETQIVEKINKLAAKLDVEPVDAKFDPVTWKVTSEEKSGKKVNVTETINKVINAPEGAVIKLVLQTVEPQHTAEQLKKNLVESGSFSTPLLDRTDARMNNITLALKKINGKTLVPNEEFSFNNVVGRRTEEKGFEEAPIIIKTEDGYEKGMGVGGGICQISTTLFNAVQNASLEITERHEHTKDVGYVPRGMDATVSYGQVDFKFKNNKQFPLMIKASIVKNRIYIKIVENRNISL